MPKFEDMQVKAKTLIEEALALLKSGMSDAEFIAGKTATAAKLHIKSKQGRIEKYRLLHELGELFHAAILDGKPVQISKRMKEISQQVAKLDKLLASTTKKISSLTVTTKTAVTTKKTTKKKTGS
ncbi:MAG TPA: hypothetical protein PKU96_06690 [bacterium]|jgi:hypothetical protein|nr:hypothetical protein [Myxococcales bacterium]OQA60796.1 MAG: hypothetical protein BWY40_00885 [bacterium ADurb.Bin270]HPW46035.1 hypothetical protein [bacterium]HQC50743.1 hypothetical protein [bacterium]